MTSVIAARRTGKAPVALKKGTSLASLGNPAAAVLMKMLFGTLGRTKILDAEKANLNGGLILAANHISHFDPFIISSVFRRKIDWMTMAEFFSHPLLAFLLHCVDAFPSQRDRAGLGTIRAAIHRLQRGRVVGLFPEGGIRDGAASILEGAKLRPGASSLADIARVPILPCVILGSDRFYAKKNWLRFRGTPIWIGFGRAIYPRAEDADRSSARAEIQEELAAEFQRLYAELQKRFNLSAADLPHPPRARMREPIVTEHEKGRRVMSVSRFPALVMDSAMCASMNLLQSRHRLDADSRKEMERYLADCERMDVHRFYEPPSANELADAIGETSNGHVTWTAPTRTQFAANNTARADFYFCGQGWKAPTVFILHALMSFRDTGYRRYAARFNAHGWNACFLHLPYHYSRVPAGHWNGELAITADLIRNAEALRQGVMEVRQLMRALRKHGCSEFAILGTSYGGWIGALLATVERDFRFVALMAPIVNVEHAIWESRGTRFLRRELAKASIDRSLVARHFHLSSPLHNQPMCAPEAILLVAGEYDQIVRPVDIERLHHHWCGSELLRVRQGHFGYRMMRETMKRLQERGL